ncbi:MAG: glycosyltransferase [Flavobacteriales bacterium]|nr:glycosyltransferase [Flavobacteriales bacterium]
MPAKKVIVSVTNDLTTDQRVHKVCIYLHNQGCEVTLVGRRLSNSLPIQRAYKYKRMRLFFSTGALFYAEYNKRLFLYLLFRKVDVLVANDLDTLLANKTAVKFKKKCALVYDSHEYFTEVPELVSRPKIQKIWEKIERKIFPKLDYIYTVNESIAKLYEEKYQKKIHVVRNMAPQFVAKKSHTKAELNLPMDKKIVLVQGAGINIDRGIEELLMAMDFLVGYHLLIIGSGDVVPLLKERAKSRSDVSFIDKMPYDEMMCYTAHADVGVSLDKDTNINYRFSLPNKIFDYIQAGVPILASNVVEVKTIVEEYKLGAIIPSHEPLDIAKTIRIIVEEMNKEDLLKNLKAAAAELNWESESGVLDRIYHPLLNSNEH